MIVSRVSHLCPDVPSTGVNMMFKVRLNYVDVAPRKNRKSTVRITSDHVASVDKSIARKIARNDLEKRASEKRAGVFFVR